MINEEARTEIPVKVTNNEDGTYTVDYQTPQPGRHTVTLHYGGLLVPTTPIKFDVEPNVDVSKIVVDGLEPSKSSKMFLICNKHIISRSQVKDSRITKLDVYLQDPQNMFL